MCKRFTVAAFAALTLAVLLTVFATPAHAQVAPVNPDPTTSATQTTSTTINMPSLPGANAPASTGGQPSGPSGPEGTANGNAGGASINLDIDGALNKPSQSILIIILITLLSVAPAALIMMTSFTRIIIVLTLTRNALGIPSIPPNQVLVGLALFLSFFIMGPTLSEMNEKGVQPYIKGEINQQQAYDAASKPLKSFMLKNTRQEELGLFSNAAGGEKPATPEDIALNVIVPAFILSEIKTAFIIGFIVFIPFLVIDIIVSSSLMSMGMMMLPPQMISLPFKLLLFVMVDGWALVVKSLLTSFN